MGILGVFWVVLGLLLALHGYWMCDSRSLRMAKIYFRGNGYRCNLRPTSHEFTMLNSVRENAAVSEMFLVVFGL